jgi:hypothetical protein
VRFRLLRTGATDCITISIQKILKAGFSAPLDRRFRLPILQRAGLTLIQQKEFLAYWTQTQSCVMNHLAAVEVFTLTVWSQVFAQTQALFCRNTGLTPSY